MLIEVVLVTSRCLICRPIACVAVLLLSCWRPTDCWIRRSSLTATWWRRWDSGTPTSSPWSSAWPRWRTKSGTCLTHTQGPHDGEDNFDKERGGGLEVFWLLALSIVCRLIESQWNEAKSPAPQAVLLLHWSVSVSACTCSSSFFLFFIYLAI